MIDSKMAKQMSFIARWGKACGMPFIAKDFLDKHPQFNWMNELLKDRPTQPWTLFRTGEKKLIVILKGIYALNNKIIQN